LYQAISLRIQIICFPVFTEADGRLGGGVEELARRMVLPGKKLLFSITTFKLKGQHSLSVFFTVS